jgi:CRP/FNR family transcriptional regulator, cyclic AMP receptor protein
MFNPFKKSYSKEDKELFRFLLRNNLFDKLTEEELAAFLPYLHLRTYVRNEVVFFRGDPSQALYIIQEGEVLLNLDIEDEFEELARLGPTQAFGDNALLENTFRIYNAVCGSDKCKLYVLSNTNIWEIFENDVTIRAKMMAAMAEDYNRFTFNLFRAYKESFGFFDLGRAFNRL